MRSFILYILIIAVLFTVNFTINPANVFAQDRAIHQTLRFKAGTNRVSLSKRVVKGTSHVYHFRARQGQHATVNLETGDKTSFSIYSLRTGVIEDADGVRDWDGNLPDSGEYTIEIGTDVSANYTLTVTIE